MKGCHLCRGPEHTTTHLRLSRKKADPNLMEPWSQLPVFKLLTRCGKNVKLCCQNLGDLAEENESGSPTETAIVENWGSRIGVREGHGHRCQFHSLPFLDLLSVCLSLSMSLQKGVCKCEH